MFFRDINTKDLNKERANRDGTYSFQRTIISHYIFYKPVSMFRTEPFPAPDHTISHYTILVDGTVNTWIEGSKVEFLPQNINDTTIVQELRPIYDTTTSIDVIARDTTIDTLYLWTDKLQDNFDNFKRWFGSGILKNGEPDVITFDSTRKRDYIDTTKSGKIIYTYPIKGIVQNKNILVDATNIYHAKFSGWNWSEYWKVANKEHPYTNEWLPNVGNERYWMENPVFDGRFVYFFQTMAYFRFDTNRGWEYYSTDHSRGWDFVWASRVYTGSSTSNAFVGAVYVDGYIYFAPYADSRLVRYNTSGPFNNSDSWETITITNLNFKDVGEKGTFTTKGYWGCCYDGEYIYFAPYNHSRFLRFNLSQANRLGLSTYSDTDTTCWEWVDSSSILGGNFNFKFRGCEYDPISDCVYFAPYYTNNANSKFVRFNKRRAKRIGSRFTDNTSWDVIRPFDSFGENFSVLGAFSGIVRKGKFIYYQPERSHYFLRYDVTKQFDSTSAYNVDTTTGWEWLFTGDVDNVGEGDAWFSGKPDHDGRYLYYSPRNSSRFVRFDTTGQWTIESVRRRTLRITPNQRDWEVIPSERVISQGYYLYNDRTSSYHITGTNGLVRAKDYIYYQPQQNYTGAGTGPFKPEVIVRFNINDKFTRRQDSPHIVYLNKRGDIEEYDLVSYSLANLTDAVTDHQKKFTDTTVSIPLWLVITDDQRRRISSIYDIRNFIPRTRDRIGRISYKGIVEKITQLPLAGNRNGDLYVVRGKTSDNRVIYIWNDNFTTEFSYIYWHPLLPDGIVVNSFIDFRFEGPDGQDRGVIGADTANDQAVFTAGKNFDFDRQDTRNIEFNIKINDTLDMNGHKVVEALGIDSTGDFQIFGSLTVDGTSVLYNLDATNVIIEGTLDTNKIIVENGKFNLVRSDLLIDRLNLQEGKIVVDNLDITGSLTITGKVNNLNISNHHTSHESFHPDYVLVDSTGIDKVDATNLVGILTDTQNCEWIQGEPVSSTAPTTNAVLKYSAGQWGPSVSTSEETLSFEEKMALYRIGMNPDRGDAKRLKDLLLRLSNFKDQNMFEKVDSTTVFGTRIEEKDYFSGACFDGKYVYFTPWNNTEFLRYDIGEGFSNENAWNKVELSLYSLNFAYAFGGSPCFDGRYIYYAPFLSESFIRYDTQGKRIGNYLEDFSFQEQDNWQIEDMTNVLTAEIAKNVKGIKSFKGCCFDGRWVYFIPYKSRYAIRFDTRSGLISSSTTIEVGLFGSKDNWEVFDLSKIVTNLSESSWEEGCFDGQYIYFGSNESKQLLRFNTRHNWIGSTSFSNKGQWLTGFTDATTWDVINISSILGKVPDHGPYFPSVFYDGKWVYYSSDSTSSGSGGIDSTMLIRFNGNEDFTVPSSWQKVDLTKIFRNETGFKHKAYKGVMFDGRWIYYAPDNGSYFLRYDTNQCFTESTSFDFIHTDSVEIGPITRKFNGIVFDGKYIYYVPMAHDIANGSTFVRFQGLDCDGKFGMR